MFFLALIFLLKYINIVLIDIISDINNKKNYFIDIYIYIILIYNKNI